METIRVHPKGFKFLFCLFHGSAAAGIVMVTSFFLQIIPYDISLIIGILMVSIPFLMAPPEIIFLIEEQKMIFRHRLNYTTIPFKNIYQLKTSARSVKIENNEKNTLLKIHGEDFKNIDLLELSEYIRNLLSGQQKVDPMKYTSVKFTGCKIIDWCKSTFRS